MRWKFNINPKTISQTESSHGCCEFSRTCEHFNAKVLMEWAFVKRRILITSNGRFCLNMIAHFCLSLMLLQAVSLFAARLSTEMESAWTLFACLRFFAALA
jgi:hypothetical protein